MKNAQVSLHQKPTTSFVFNFYFLFLPILFLINSLSNLESDHRKKIIYRSELTIINVKKYLTMKIANVYQQIESIGSVMVNLLNFLLAGWRTASSCSVSFVTVRMAAGVDENDGVRDLLRFPFGRFKLLFWSWFDSSAEADRSLGVSREIDDGTWWILNAGLFWSIFFARREKHEKQIIEAEKRRKGRKESENSGEKEIKNESWGRWARGSAWKR